MAARCSGLSRSSPESGASRVRRPGAAPPARLTLRGGAVSAPGRWRRGTPGSRAGGRPAGPSTATAPAGVSAHVRMRSFSALLKLTGGGIIVLAFAFGQTFGVCLRRWFPLAARRYANRVTSLGCRAFLRHWGVIVTLRNARHVAPGQACLYALNHLSYLDILVHGALFPSTS